MREVAAREQVTLEDAGEALALRGSRHVDVLDTLEVRNRQDITRLDRLTLVERKFLEHAHLLVRQTTRLLLVTSDGLREALLLLFAKTELGGHIAVLLKRLDLHNRAGTDFKHRHAEALAVDEHLGHADLLANQTFHHNPP